MVEIWHQGRRVETAKRVDVLANCFVPRHGSTKNVILPAASETAPEGFAMRALTDDDEDLF